MTETPGESTAGMPTIDQVRAWLDLSESQVSNADLARLWDAARAAQTNACRALDIADEEWPGALVLALLRRVSRSLAAEDLPLGYLGDGEFGPSRLLNYDAVIEELEGPWRKVVTA